MKLFDFFRRYKKKGNSVEDNFFDDKTKWTGKDFEFLIVGEIEIKAENFEEIMTPKSLPCKKIEKNDWIYFKTGDDEFSYSWEMPGIQMTFNPEISFDKAKLIADEVIENIKSTGQFAELIIINSTKIYRFD